MMRAREAAVETPSTVLVQVDKPAAAATLPDAKPKTEETAELVPTPAAIAEPRAEAEKATAEEPTELQVDPPTPNAA